MAAYRISLVWLLRVVVIAAVVLMAFAMPALVDGSDGMPGWSDAVTVFVLACVALAIGESLAKPDATARAFDHALGWVMRVVAVGVLLWSLPTVFGVVGSFFVSQMAPLDMLSSLALTISSLVSGPLLLLGSAELMHSARRHLPNGQAS